MDLGDLLSPLHLAILLIIALLIFGPRRLPELGGAVGKTIQSFRAAMREEPKPEPATAQPAALPAGTVATPQGATAPQQTTVEAAAVEQQRP